MKNKILSIKPVIFCLLLFSVFSSAAQSTALPAPGFSLSDINGKTVSLSDFKGKVVYIDFWATWCKACVEEIPYSKDLQEKFSNNPDIVFITISFDQDIERWKKKVKAKKMLGVHLISPEGGETKVMKDYNVMYIPHFVLIDKNGMIVDKRAKKPSEPGVIEDLNKALAQ